MSTIPSRIITHSHFPPTQNTCRRDGRPIEELGYYDPILKKYKFDVDKIKKWLSYGVKPTETALSLLKKAEIVSVS